MKTATHVFARTVAAALLLAGGSARAGAPAPGQPAIDFQAPALNGGTVKLSSLRGKVVLVDFWASWCEPCKKELPRLAKMAKKLHGNGIEILAINVDTDRHAAEEFLHKNGVDLNVLLDPSGSVVGRYDPPKMPTSYVVDREGVIRHVNAGFEEGDEAKIEHQLTALASR